MRVGRFKFFADREPFMVLFGVGVEWASNYWAFSIGFLFWIIGVEYSPGLKE